MSKARITHRSKVNKDHSVPTEESVSDITAENMTTNKTVEPIKVVENRIATRHLLANISRFDPRSPLHCGQSSGILSKGMKNV
jgi:hypothetical protein